MVWTYNANIRIIDHSDEAFKALVSGCPSSVITGCKTFARVYSLSTYPSTRRTKSIKICALQSVRLDLKDSMLVRNHDGIEGKNTSTRRERSCVQILYGYSCNLIHRIHSFSRSPIRLIIEKKTWYIGGESRKKKILLVRQTCLCFNVSNVIAGWRPFNRDPLRQGSLQLPLHFILWPYKTLPTKTSKMTLSLLRSSTKKSRAKFLFLCCLPHDIQALFSPRKFCSCFD